MDKEHTLRAPSRINTTLPANGTALTFLFIGKPEFFHCMDAILIRVDVMDP